jgi:hypothetical protein
MYQLFYKEFVVSLMYELEGTKTVMISCPFPRHEGI